MQDFTRAEYLNAVYTGALTSNNPSAWILRSMLDATPYMRPIHIKLHMVALRLFYRMDNKTTAESFLEALRYHIRSADTTDTLTSARVCLADAEACFERRDFKHAISRCIKGFEYLGFTHLTRA